MGALDDTATAVNTLIAALNQIQTQFTATQASITTAHNKLVHEIGTTTHAQVRHVTQASINATQHLTEATNHLQSAVDAAAIFATELGLHQPRTNQPKTNNTPPNPDDTNISTNQTTPAKAHSPTTANTHACGVLADVESVLVRNNGGRFDAEAAAEGLPKWSAGQTTFGRASGRDANGTAVKFDLLWSGDKKNHAGLIGAINAKLQVAGILPGSSRSARASDLEQKFAAFMNRRSIVDADVVINNPNGPCQVRLGCDQTLNHILDSNRGLSVHWRDNDGVWQRADYGTRRRR